MAAATANNGGAAKVATEFEKIIHAARERKKAEELAAKIFGKDRRQSAGPGPLSSRAGVKKNKDKKRLRHSTGNVHVSTSTPALGPLASRITDPNAFIPPAANRNRQKRHAAKLAQALIRSELQQPPNNNTQQKNDSTPSPNGAPPTAPTGPAATSFSKNQGFQIRGLAGPYVVMAQNFAPGTTAADIESAMTPVGGIIESCRIIKQRPIVIAEIVFESKEGAQKVIDTFNNQTADGRVLSVYFKPGNTPSTYPPSRPSSDRDAMVIDGSYGFPESDTTSGGLYSDEMVKTNRWGRGFNKAGRFSR